MSARKTWGRILAGHRNVRFADFERLLRAFGFELKRTTGSHRVYRHPAVPRPLSVQPRGGEAKPYQVAQLVALVEEFGLTLGE